MTDLHNLITQAQLAWKIEGTYAMVDKVYRYLGMKVFGDNFSHKPIINCIHLYATRNSTFIDIGANVGTITKEVATQFKECLAIEPDPQNFARLQRVIESNKLTNCRTAACALSDRSGSAILYQSSFNSGDNSLVKREDLTKGVNVSVTTLDALVKRNDLREPFVIKIDVQGYEIFVLRGAEQTLTKQCVIISEFWPWGLRMVGHQPKDYLDFIRSHDYVPLDLTGRPIEQPKLDLICDIGKSNKLVVADMLLLKKQC